MLETQDSAQAAAEAVNDIYEAVTKGQLDYFKVLGLVNILIGVAPTLKEVADATTEEKAFFAAELVDALTGDDDTALPITRDFIPGLTAVQEEQLFDMAKQVVLEKITAEAV